MMKIVFIGSFGLKEIKEYKGAFAEKIEFFDKIESFIEGLHPNKDCKYLIFIDREYAKNAQTLKDLTIAKGISSRIFVNVPNVDLSIDSSRIISFDFDRYGGIANFLSNIEKQSSRFVGTSEFIRKLREDMIFFSFSNLNVFISGETGTGKSLAAQIIHYISNRRGQRFLELNCSNVPEDLLESELFGHAKGAFTNAYTEKKGLLEETDKGTIFLDEIGEMAPHVQSKLLKVIENHKFMPVGSNKEINIDVRFCAATNQDPNLHVREDLFQRIAEVRIEMIPLRERKEDIPLLIDHFLAAANYTIKFENFSDEVKNAFFRHKYPGNIRELRNIITRFVEFSEIPGNEKITQYDPNAFAKHELTERFITSMADLYMEQSEPVNVLFKRIRAKLEREVTRRVLDSYKWDKNLAAKKMGVSRKTIDNMIKKYDLDKRKAKISVRNTKVSGSNRTI